VVRTEHVDGGQEKRKTRNDREQDADHSDTDERRAESFALGHGLTG
jgi:hypothetical protein